MAKARLLIVEDEPSHQMLINKALGADYELTFAHNHAQGELFIENEDFDLFLLDIMLDESDGYDLCAKIKQIPRLKKRPIIFLTAKSDVSNKVIGFELGADDYIVKPCDPSELRARVRAKLARYAEFTEAQNQLVVGDLIFDLEHQTVKIEGDHNNNPFELTPLEFKLLHYLARNEGYAISREDILKDVWGEQTNVLARSVDTYVAMLRRKLGPYGKAINAVRGVGYRFTPQKVWANAS